MEDAYRISWTENKSNEEVLREAGIEQTMIKRIFPVSRHEKAWPGNFGGDW